MIVTHATDAAFPVGDTLHARLAVDATHVYWTETGPQGRVRRASRATRNVEIVAADQPFATGIATDGSWVYWTTHFDGGVWGCPVSGCRGPATLLARATSRTLDLALVGANLYVTTFGNAALDGELFRVRK
jgi:hypothetical protein